MPENAGAKAKCTPSPGRNGVLLWDCIFFPLSLSPAALLRPRLMSLRCLPLPRITGWSCRPFPSKPGLSQEPSDPRLHWPDSQLTGKAAFQADGLPLRREMWKEVGPTSEWMSTPKQAFLGYPTPTHCQATLLTQGSRVWRPHWDCSSRGFTEGTLMLGPWCSLRLWSHFTGTRTAQQVSK